MRRVEEDNIKDSIGEKNREEIIQEQLEQLEKLQART
jgi:hypothetical protein